MWGQGIGELFVRGGGVMWPLLACSVLAVAVAVERIAVLLWRSGSYQRLIDALRPLVRQGQLVEARQLLAPLRSPLARVARTYLEHVGSPGSLREEIVSREASVELTLLERRMHWLAVIGHLAPMIGLLGTVVGLVEAFHQIERVGGQVQPSDLASGIWKALLTTVFGLSIALPTLAVYHFLDQRVGAVSLQMQWLTAHLNEWTAGASPQPAAATAPPSAAKKSAPMARRSPEAPDMGVSAAE